MSSAIVSVLEAVRSTVVDVDSHRIGAVLCLMILAFFYFINKNKQ